MTANSSRYLLCDTGKRLAIEPPPCPHNIGVGVSKPERLMEARKTLSLSASLGRVAARIETGQLAAEIAGERSHAGTAAAGFGIGVVVGVGVDVVGIDRAVGVGDELDAGDADVVGGEEGLV